MEWNAWSEGNSAEYLCTLPFSAAAERPDGLHPGIFDIYYDRAKADPGRIQWNGDNSQCCIKTTLARQIANWVIIYSPAADGRRPDRKLRGTSGFPVLPRLRRRLRLVRSPAGRDRRLPVVVRRAKERYFLGAGTNADARTIDQPLGFLQPGVTYTARIYADDPQSSLRTAYRIEERQVTAADSLRIEMAANGGCAVSFEPVQK